MSIDKKWIAGVRAAADVASNYDAMSAHDHLVSDCILCKLNVTKRRHPRPNRHKEDVFLRGFAVALAELIRLHHQPSIAVSIMRSNGITLGMLRAAKVDGFDLSVLAKEVKSR